MAETFGNENDTLFRRAEILHQMLMEDFRFMEAARMYSGEYESAMLNTDNLFRKVVLRYPHYCRIKIKQVNGLKYSDYFILNSKGKVPGACGDQPKWTS